MKPTIAAIILTKNEEKMIANCIETVKWCDEVVVIDNESEDRTVSLAEHAGATVVTVKDKSFAARRNEALSHVKADWVMYIDADERIVPALAKEILVHIETTKAVALGFLRQNMQYGKIFHHGGWAEEKMVRVFRNETFKGWTGDIHESPVFDGEVIFLHTPLLHFTHRNTIDCLTKTIHWTPAEADLLVAANIPPVTLFTLLRKGFMEFVRRAFFQAGRKDGMEGWIEALVQGMNRVLVYIQVWERQQHPSLEEKYEAKEREVVELWQKSK